jgi:hypothetical protein
MASVFVVHHVHELGDCEDTKLIGVYSSQVGANLAVGRAMVQPGFRENPNGFSVEEYEVDKDHWVEGFVTVAVGQETETQ